MVWRPSYDDFWEIVYVQRLFFLLITHAFKTSWTLSLVATHTKSGMPRRSKGSNHGVKKKYCMGDFHDMSSIPDNSDKPSELLVSF